LEILSAAAAAFPQAVQDLLQKALAVRDRYQAGEITLHGQYTAAGRIEAQMARLLEKTYHAEANRRLAKHLDHEFPYLFTFLHCPGLEATNNRAERDVRPAIPARHPCGGSRTWDGAHTQEVLSSILRTCQKQGKDSFDLLVGLFQDQRSRILDLLPSSLAPPAGPNPLTLPCRSVPPGQVPGR